MVGPIVIGTCRFQSDWRFFRELIFDYFAHELGELRDRIVFVTGIECFTGDKLFRRFQKFDVKVGHVLDVDVGPFLRAAEYRDDTFVHRVIG